MKRIVAAALAGAFAVALATSALACGAHPAGHTAGISKPVTMAEKPIMTPKPVTGG